MFQGFWRDGRARDARSASRGGHGGRRRSKRRQQPRVDGLEPRLVLSLASGLVATEVAKFAVASLPGGDASRVSTDLLMGYNRGLEARPMPMALQARAAGDSVPLKTDAQGRIQVNITTSNAALLAPSLAAAGASIIATLPEYNLIEAYIPWAALPAISNLGDKGLMGVVGVPQPTTSAGSLTSEGVNVMRSDRVQAGAGYDGTGIKVGVLSDGYNYLGGAAADVAKGDLPPDVQVLQDFVGGADEGRAMLQIIHDVAPGASLAFATAFISESGFAANIQALAAAGANVITDDVTYPIEPFFQPGIIAQAVNDVVTTMGVSYFSSAGNFATQSYDTSSAASYGSNALNFVTATIPGVSASAQRYFDFDPSGAVNNKMTFTIPNRGGIGLSFQWDQPYYTLNGVTSDLDLFLLDHNTGTVVASSRASNLINQTPFEYLDYQNNTGDSRQYDLVIQLYSGGAPGVLKFVNYGSNRYGRVDFGAFATNSGAITPHAAVANAMAVGAVPFYDQRTPENFSSFGPTTFLFDAAGVRLGSPETIAKPDIMAPDGGSNTFFGGIGYNGKPSFYGTSAAAPHAAGVAAQMLQANSSLTPSGVYAALKATADPNVGSGNPNQVGSGLINAFAAIFGGPVAANGNTSDNFESGALGANWEVYTSGAGRVQVSSANGPASGSYHLVMDGNANGYNLAALDGKLNEAILHVNLAGRTNATLSFDYKFFNAYGYATPAMPTRYSGHGNATGVSFSVDGVNWYKITSLGGSSPTPYSTYSINLSAVAASHGVTLGADTRIKFQEYNDISFWAPGLGLAIDNVSVNSSASLPSALTGIQIDDGSARRSAVRSITLTFQGNVVTLPSSAFNLKRTDDNQSFPVNVGAPIYAGGVTTVVLTFGGPNLNGTSLSDGHYALTIDGAQILDNFGNKVDAANNGVAGSAGTANFFRFFGDSNGDGLVDAVDFLAFRTAYLTGVATGSNAIYDFDGDGVFSILDLNAFTANFTKRKLR